VLVGSELPMGSSGDKCLEELSMKEAFLLPFRCKHVTSRKNRDGLFMSEPSPRRVSLRLMRQLSSTTRIPPGLESPIHPISQRGSPRLFSSASLDSTFTTTNGDEAPPVFFFDTIFALSLGASATQAMALAVIQISGPDATEPTEAASGNRESPAGILVFVCASLLPLSSTTTSSRIR
jgi:hypothetical protein